ncbi:hypothetical protein QE152_g27457 [Popillia japonica]|uniref:Uncharacterized protein n=1 Tax=Popillia japonica TaxID=7064 RepID=A0AAW1JVC1_POPJA
MSTPSIDVTSDYPINREETINAESLVRWTQLVTLLSSIYPNIHSLMQTRNTSTDKMFSEIWTEMRSLYMKVVDSTENVSWETFKKYLEQNISSRDAEPLHESGGFDGECLVGDLQKVLGTKHLVHSVLGYGGYRDCDDRCERIKTLHQSGRGQQPFIAVAVHPEEDRQRSHLHIIHACPYSNRTCRCRFIGHYSRGASKCVRRGDVTVSYLRNLLQYINTWPRHHYYIHIPGTTGQVLYPAQGVQICGCADCTAGEAVDESTTGHEICGMRSSRGSNNEAHHEPHLRGASAFQRSPENRTSSKEEEVYQLVKQLCITPINNTVLSIKWHQLVKQLCITPINNTVLSIKWLQSPFKFMQRGSPMLQTIFNTWSRELKHMTISDLLQIYKETQPFFSCTSAYISDFYYSTDESLERCNALLEFQFPDIDVRVIEAHDNFRPATNLQRNTTIFFVHIRIHFRFLLFNRRISRTLQCIIRISVSGHRLADNTPANVKYENQVVIEKTPLLITTNTDVFPTSDGQC